MGTLLTRQSLFHRPVLLFEEPCNKQYKLAFGVKFGGRPDGKPYREATVLAGEAMFSDVSLPQWAQAILNLRRRLGLSQSEFGARLHYSAMAVSRWETGKQEPTSRCLIQLGNMAAQPDCWMFWSRAGLKSSDLRQVLPGWRAAARMTTSQDFDIVHAGGGAKQTRAKGALIGRVLWWIRKGP